MVYRVIEGIWDRVLANITYRRLLKAHREAAIPKARVIPKAREMEVIRTAQAVAVNAQAVAANAQAVAVNVQDLQVFGAQR